MIAVEEGNAHPSIQAPIRRITLHEEIANRLRDMIIEGVLTPGDKIHETNVGTMLGVSRTPLREAVKFLASEGLVELNAGRGAVVRSFDEKDVEDMMTVLSSLEVLAGRLACRKASAKDIAAVRRLHDEMVERYEAGERLAYYKLNQSIHSAIVAMADNRALAETHTALQNRLKRIRFIGHEGSENWAAAVREHEAIIAALQARDEARLAAVVDRHLEGAWQRVRGFL